MPIYSFSKTTVSLGNQTLTVPETGTYFMHMDNGDSVVYVSALQKPDSQALVPIPGELTNIKGGYDLPAGEKVPLFSGTFSSGDWAYNMIGGKEWSTKPITLETPLIVGNIVTIVSNGSACTGIVQQSDEGTFVICDIYDDALYALSDDLIGASSSPDIDLVITITQYRPETPVIIPAKYIENASEMKELAETALQVAQNAATASDPVITGSFSQNRNPNGHIGPYSHTEGYYCIADATSGHAEGSYVIVHSKNQHAQGKYNIIDASNKYAHIVGNGSDANRSNAHTLDWNGVAWFQGRPQFGGTAQDNGSQTVMANGDKEIILASSTAGSTKQFKITVDDTGTLTATEVTGS